MRTTRRWRPEVEALEGRTLLSAGPGLAGTAPALVARHGHHKPLHHHQGLALSGQLGGTWETVPTLPDVGHTQTLTGTGAVTPLGAVSVSGALHTPGFVARGRAGGTLTLTAANGSLVLQLVGPWQPGFSPPPATFQYTITGGTGADTGASGHGTVTFQEQENPVPDCPPNALCVPLMPSGTFVLTFRPAAG